MKKIFNISLLVILVFAMAGCNKYLEKKPDTLQTVPESLVDLQRLLDNSAVMNLRTGAEGETSADDYFLTPQRYSEMSPFDLLYSWQYFPHVFRNDWAYTYEAVYTTNLCLEQIAKVEKTAINANEWNNVYGAALFYRSYHFLDALWTFAKAYDETTASSDPGIVIRTQSDISVPSIRASVKEGYKKVIEDAMLAIDHLPETQITPFRPTKAAAYGLLARVYLSMRNYDSAYKYSDLALGLKNALLDFNNTAEVKAGNVPFAAYPYNKEVVFYTAMNNTPSPKSPANALIDTTLYASYSIDDKRRTAFFRPNSGYQRFKGTYAASSVTLFTGIATDELYLIRAESKAKMGGHNEAMDDLNTLLSTRYITNTFVPLTAGSVDEAVAIIRTERRKELLMRGLRWSDVKRYNKENANIELKRVVLDQTFTLPPNDNRYAITIPDDIILLTGMPQNPR